MAREGEGAQFDSDPQERGSDCKFGCRGIALHATEKGSVCSEHIFHLEEMGLLGWASNYASPGLLFCVAEGPAPRHLQGRHAGGYYTPGYTLGSKYKIGFSRSSACLAYTQATY